MRAITPAVSACGRGIPGQVSVRLEFGSSGAVTDASISDVNIVWASAPGPGCDSTPDSSGYYSCRRARAPVPEVDDCILRALRAARVPPFAAPSFRVSYPFRY